MQTFQKLHAAGPQLQLIASAAWDVMAAVGAMQQQQQQQHRGLLQLQVPSWWGDHQEQHAEEHVQVRSMQCCSNNTSSIVYSAGQ
jgi:hypothetical protein